MQDFLVNAIELFAVVKPPLWVSPDRSASVHAFSLGRVECGVNSLGERTYRVVSGGTTVFEFRVRGDEASYTTCIDGAWRVALTEVVRPFLDVRGGWWRAPAAATVAMPVLAPDRRRHHRRPPHGARRAAVTARMSPSAIVRRVAEIVAFAAEPCTRDGNEIMLSVAAHGVEIVLVRSGSDVVLIVDRPDGTAMAGTLARYHLARPARLSRFVGGPWLTSLVDDLVRGYPDFDERALQAFCRREG